MEVSAEVHFAQTLASNDKKFRDRALKRLRKYINVRSCHGEGLSHEDYIKIWKGLHYCMWMQDKPIIQEELSRTITDLLHAFTRLEDMLSFVHVFFITETREWGGIDRLRLDKFMMLMRDILHETFLLLSRESWPVEACQMFAQNLTSGVMRDDSVKMPYGIKIHLADIYLVELTKVSLDGMTSKKLTLLMLPFIYFILKTKRRDLACTVFEKTVNLVLNRFGLWSWLSKGIGKGENGERRNDRKLAGSDDDYEEEDEEEEEVMGSEESDEGGMEVDDDDDEEEERSSSRKKLKFDLSTMLRLMQTLASDPDVESKNRSLVYGIVKSYFRRDASILNTSNGEDVGMTRLFQLTGEIEGDKSGKRKRRKKRRREENDSDNDDNNMDRKSKAVIENQDDDDNNNNKVAITSPLRAMSHISVGESKDVKSKSDENDNINKKKKKKKNKTANTKDSEEQENDNDENISTHAKSLQNGWVVTESKSGKKNKNKNEINNTSGLGNSDGKVQTTVAGKSQKRKRLSSGDEEEDGFSGKKKKRRVDGTLAPANNNDSNNNNSDNKNSNSNAKSALSVDSTPTTSKAKNKKMALITTSPVQCVVYKQKSPSVKPKSVNQLAKTLTSVPTPTGPSLLPSTFSPSQQSPSGKKGKKSELTSLASPPATSSTPTSTSALDTLYNVLASPCNSIKKAVSLVAPMGAQPASAPAKVKAGTTPEQCLTPGSQKKVIFDLRRNKANKFQDYLKTLAKEPFAYEPSKSPVQGILKSPSAESFQSSNVSSQNSTPNTSRRGTKGKKGSPSSQRKGSMSPVLRGIY